MNKTNIEHPTSNAEHRTCGMYVFKDRIRLIGEPVKSPRRKFRYQRAVVKRSSGATFFTIALY